METIAQKNRVELLVSDTGKAILLHEGLLSHDYVWVQYEKEMKSLVFVTEEGELIALGMTIHQAFEDRLLNTEELLVVTINEDKSRNPAISLTIVQTAT